MRRFSCAICRHDVFFDNTVCVGCGADLGYAPALGKMLASKDGREWRVADAVFVPCANRTDIDCNWVVSPDEEDCFCAACRHNRVIPDLTVAGNAALWRKIELAKRTLFYSLIEWGLPHPTKLQDSARGLAFDFLADEEHSDGSVRQHLTGHSSGLITINIAEGDDAERERRRTEMGEPYRTLVGHFRHEVGHYYFDRLIAAEPEKLAALRDLFGDERTDYGAALGRHYANGPAPDWPDRFVTGYASAHPWEDFAETFAHTVHMVDGLETASAFGAMFEGVQGIEMPYRSAKPARDFVSAWVPLTVAANALNRSMGQPDLYPFVLPRPVREKLGFVLDLVRAGSSGLVSEHALPGEVTPSARDAL